MDNKFEVSGCPFLTPEYFPLQSQLLKTTEIIDGTGLIGSTLMLLFYYFMTVLSYCY